MIIVDTNVVSEAVKANCDAGVRQWFNRQDPEELFITAINVAELRFGVEIMPNGRRKRDLFNKVETLLLPVFQNRVLAFDLQAAGHYAKIYAAMRLAGRAIGVSDCQIAAIAMSHGFAIATRDAGPFRDAGVEVINPWSDDKPT